LFFVGACKPFKEAFMACLKANKNDNGACRLESKAYLECRMEKYVRFHSMGNIKHVLVGKDVDTFMGALPAAS
jgi:hypothetical protein